MNYPFKDLNLSPSMAFFKNNIQEVNIEISGYCNRKCPYCPNVLEAGYRRELMDRALFTGLLEDLRKIDFAGTIHLNLFNEPLHDLDYFFWAADQCATIVPEAKHNLHTNGDYIKDEGTLVKLLTSGLNSVCITIHYPDSWDHDRQLERLKTFMEKVGVGFLPLADNGNFIQAAAKAGSTTLSIRTINFQDCGQDRGGTLSGSVLSQFRTKSCGLPRWQINVNYLGEVYPCCNVVPRQEFGGEYCLGSLKDKRIFDIYSSKWAQDFIDCTAKISGDTPHLTPKACRTCSDSR